MPEQKPLSLPDLFKKLVYGQLTREQFEGFVQSMRERPDRLEVLDMELNDYLAEEATDREEENYDFAQQSKDTIDGDDLKHSKTQAYQALAVDVFRWFDANTRHFESNFISALWQQPYISVHLDDKAGKISFILGNEEIMKYPNEGSSQLARIFLKSRPDGYFAGIGLGHQDLAKLGQILGERLMKENVDNLPVLGKLFANDLSL
jgi:hypothetical protein